MGPRVSTPKPSDDTDTSIVSSVFKPKTKRAKVEKAVPSGKAAKTTKPKVVKMIVESTSKVEKNNDVDSGVRVEGERKGLGRSEGDGKGKVKAKEKEKVEKVTGDEAADLIRGYLMAQNRPYGVTDVVANLRGQVARTVADKILKELENNGEIMGKGTKPKGKDGKDPAGTQWVFWCKQEPPEAISSTDLAVLDATISTLRSTLPTLKSQHKSLLAALSALKSSPRTEDLHKTIALLRSANEGKRGKLKAFQEGEVKMVSKEEMERVEREQRYWDGKRRARKAAFANLEAVLGERWTKSEVWEGAGVEEVDE